MAHDLEGIFPFGAKSERCPAREATPAKAVVLGVYPSALHIRWVHPEYGIRALAVAPEPWPFWDGKDEVERVEAWRKERDWDDDWGSALPAGRLNGSSGVAVRDRVLEPLGFKFSDVWLTDALPFFFIQSGKGKQGDAMRGRYDKFAAAKGLEPHELPARPTPSELVRRAVNEEGERLRDEIQRSQAPLLITLGNEALQVARGILDDPQLPRKLSPGHEYGQRFATTLDGTALEVLPLVHPGQRSAVWLTAHEEWAARAR